MNTVEGRGLGKLFDLISPTEQHADAPGQFVGLILLAIPAAPGQGAPGQLHQCRPNSRRWLLGLKGPAGPMLRAWLTALCSWKALYVILVRLWFEI